MWGQWLSSTVGYFCWLGSLPKKGCSLGFAAAWVPQLAFLDGQNEGDAEQEGKDDNLLSCPGCVVKQALQPVQSGDWGT